MTNFSYENSSSEGDDDLTNNNLQIADKGNFKSIINKIDNEKRKVNLKV